MKKQRWRITKMKKWVCDGCFKPTKVEQGYEPETCCDGYMCGCYGKPNNPVFCEKCEEQLFGRGI
ncbi:hypothetical protein LCG60_27125 [Bacillus sp. SD-4]|nr:hypothetical protein LCG60_27125 [Bacillus sp. SD-4]